MKFVILSPSGIRTGGPEACFQLSDTKIFKPENLLLTTEIFFNAPAGKIMSCNPYHVIFGL